MYRVWTATIPLKQHWAKSSLLFLTITIVFLLVWTSDCLPDLNQVQRMSLQNELLRYSAKFIKRSIWKIVLYCGIGLGLETNRFHGNYSVMFLDFQKWLTVNTCCGFSNIWVYIVFFWDQWHWGSNWWRMKKTGQYWISRWFKISVNQTMKTIEPCDTIWSDVARTVVTLSRTPIGRNG